MFTQCFCQKVFAEVEEDAYSGGDVGNLVTSQVDWPSEDDEDDDYNPEKLMQNGSARENGINDDGNSDSDSDSSTGSDSNSTGSSEVVFFDEFAGKSRGKKRSHSEEEETELSDEDIVSQKRQRPDVDYKQLSSQPKFISFSFVKFRFFTFIHFTCISFLMKGNHLSF